MPTYKTRGIVLGRHNIGEADRLITFITPDRGKLRGVARGVRRIKSRQAGHLELFAETNLMLAVGRRLDVVASAQLITHHDLTLNWRNLSYAYLLAEMINKLTDEGAGSPSLYQLVQEIYRELGRTAADSLVELYLKLRLLGELGYRPHLDGCVVCGSKDADSDYYFNPELGGVAEATCTTIRSYPLSVTQIKLWREIMAQPLLKLRQFKGAVDLAEPSLPAADAFYDYLFGRRFISASLLAK